MKLIFQTLVVLSFLPLASFSQSENFVVEGKVNQNYNGKFIKLLYSEGQTKKKDSTEIKKGAFKFAGSVAMPTAAKITLGNEDNGDRIDLFLSNGTVRVTTKDSIRFAKISGTKLAEEFEVLAKRLRPADNWFVNGLNAFKSMPEGAEKKAYISKLMEGFDEYLLNKRTAINEFASEYPDSYISLYYLDKNSPGTLINYEATYPYYAKLSPELKATPLGIELEQRLIASKGVLTGQQFKDFVSTTPDGKELSLKEVIATNKYTLVDFWASWCGPCRKENPNVVKTFNDFKGKGFTVLSVSLDEDAAKWKAAIEKDGMPWHHVSSLKGWKEPAAVLYNIRAIPQNVLVDSNGKIIATNLRAETLYNKMQALLK
jgi:thiol-disulfide isomerase/thioredoxin